MADTTTTTTTTTTTPAGDEQAFRQPQDDEMLQNLIAFMTIADKRSCDHSCLRYRTRKKTGDHGETLCLRLRQLP